MKTIIVFLRYPVPGQVKNRLAKSVGSKESADIYKKMAEKVIATIYQTEHTNIIFFIDDNRYDKECSVWLGVQENIRVQAGADIGERMAGAFGAVLKGGAHQALLIGTDIPSLTAAIVNKAFAELKRNDSVLGPTVDGGYYLIGLKSPADFLFTTMTWSTNTVFAETFSRIKNHGMSCGLLPVLRDIDTLEDLEHEGFGNYSRAQ